MEVPDWSGVTAPVCSMLGGAPQPPSAGAAASPAVNGLFWAITGVGIPTGIRHVNPLTRIRSEL